jgi:hypothetical protein
MREVVEQIPRRQRQHVEIVEIRGAQIGDHTSIATIGESGDTLHRAAVLELLDQIKERVLALAGDAVVDRRKSLEGALRNRTDVRTAENGDHTGTSSFARRDARRIGHRSRRRQTECVGLEGSDLLTRLLDRSSVRLRIDEMNAVAALPRHRGEDQHTETGNRLLRLVSGWSRPVPENEGRLAENERALPRLSGIHRFATLSQSRGGRQVRKETGVEVEARSQKRSGRPVSINVIRS